MLAAHPNHGTHTGGGGGGGGGQMAEVTEGIV